MELVNREKHEHHNNENNIADYPIDIKYDSVAIKEEYESITEIVNYGHSTFVIESKTKSDFIVKSEDNNKAVFDTEFENSGERHNDEAEISDFPIDIKYEPLAIKQECESVDARFAATLESKSKTTSNFISKSETDDLLMDNPQLRCDICRQASLSSAEALAAHRYTHTWDTNFTCLICQKTFHMKQHMHTHMLNTHSISTSVTLNTYKRNQSNRKHYDFINSKQQRIYAGDKSYKCDICRKRFLLKGNLTKHKRIHSGDKPFECDICHKRFTDSSNLHAHKRIHSGEEPFECDICQKRFTHCSSLIVHKRIHSGEKRYECDICQKRFVQLITLVSHKRVHSGEKPHECDICHKRYAQSCSLIAHKRNNCGKNPYECEFCHKRFTESNPCFCHKKFNRNRYLAGQVQVKCLDFRIRRPPVLAEHNYAAYI